MADLHQQHRQDPDDAVLWLLITTRPSVGIIVALAALCFSVFIWQCKKAHQNHRHLMSNDALLEAYASSSSAKGSKPRSAATY